MPVSLGNLIVLLTIIGVIYLVKSFGSSSGAKFKTRSKQSTVTWPPADWFDDVAVEQDGDLPESLLPEIYQVVVARALYALQGLAFLCLTLSSITGALLFLVLSAGAALASRAFRKDVAGTWLESHFSSQIHNFWLTQLWLSVVAIAADFQREAQGSALIQWPGYLLLAIWLTSRIARGWKRLRTQSPMDLAPLDWGSPKSQLDATSDSSSLTYLRVVYALQVMALSAHVLGAKVSSLLLLIAALASYLRRRRLRGTWLGSHIDWQLRTSLYGVLALLLVNAFLVPLMLTVKATLLITVSLGATAGWLAYRIIRGWQALSQRGSTLPAGYFSQQRTNGNQAARHHVSVVGVAAGILILVAYIIESDLRGGEPSERAPGTPVRQIGS